ncbi:hypothetical protein I553_3820 [Mycobacterium xenopi 4042]|uniref:Uncharacterized protein n=1 Tax=Mycobacterium xenopi 4042 TaxID=1299334 RepID=X8A0X2_MYCXE|nr:hypothetical protein I553_3820 [Mycobacterium xenopi 4042]
MRHPANGRHRSARSPRHQTQKVPAKHGWRAALFALTKINLGPAKTKHTN